MGLKSFFRELKRRNIYRVAVTYAITGWIIMQIATSVFPALEFPDWTTQFVIILVLIGFPIAIVLAWAFEITPEGLKRTRDVSKGHSISHHTGRKLNYWIIGLLSLAVMLLLVERIWWAGAYTSNKPSSPKQKKASVAVLPFDDYSPEGDQQWFSDGLTEEILNSLARVPELRVPARTSSFMFRDADISIEAIADSLNVRHVVEGSVRRFKDQMRITAQLIRAKDGSHIWSNTYDASTDSFFKVQQDIAEQITSALDIYLDEKKRSQMFAFGTRNLKAYEAYLKGSKIYYSAHEKWQLKRLWEANKWFERAYRLDPTFAAPYFKHSDPYTHFLTDDLQNSVDTLSLKRAYEQMRSDMNNAIQHAKNPEVRLFYRFAREFLSPSWNQLPDLVEQIQSSPEARNTYARRGTGWIEMLPGLGYAALGHQLQEARIKQDPLNRLTKFFNGVALIGLEKNDQLQRMLDSLSTPAPFIRANLASLVHTKDINKLRDVWANMTPSENTFPAIAKGWKVMAGLDKMNREELNAYVQQQDSARATIFVSFAAGFPDIANQIARKIDAQILGSTNLVLLMHEIGMYIPFSLEATPNLKRQFREADIQTKPDTLFGRPVQKIVQKKYRTSGIKHDRSNHITQYRNPTASRR